MKTMERSGMRPAARKPGQRCSAMGLLGLSEKGFNLHIESALMALGPIGPRNTAAKVYNCGRRGEGRHRTPCLSPGKYSVDTPSQVRDLVGFPHANHSSIFITMAHSEVLLVKPVEGLGGEGDQVKVRAGYARNYLLPRSMAVPVTT